MPWGGNIQPSIGEVPADTGLRQKTLNNKRLVAEGKEEEAKKKKSSLAALIQGEDK